MAVQCDSQRRPMRALVLLPQTSTLEAPDPKRPLALNGADLLLGPWRPRRPRSFARADNCDHIDWGRDA
jgi:hypothetical protein